MPENEKLVLKTSSPALGRVMERDKQTDRQTDRDRERRKKRGTGS